MRGHARARTVVALGALLVLAVVATPSPAHAEPRIDVSSNRVPLGGEIEVRASGFAPGELVDLKICGAPDESGKLACGDGIAGVEVDAAGAVKQTLAVQEPPGDCPCTVVVDSIGHAPVLSRIELVGHPMAKKAVAPELVVDSAEITGGSLFGFGGSSALKLELRNAGVSPAKATLELSWREGDGEPRPITDPELPEIAPQTSRTVTVPLDLGGFKQGTYHVTGSAVVGDLYAPVETARSFVPWGLYGLVALVLVAGALVRARAVVRDAADARSAESTPAAARPEPQAEKARPEKARSEKARAAKPQAAPKPRRVVTRTPPRPAPASDEVERGEPAPTVHAAQAEPLVGPPRLAATPLARLADAAAATGPASSVPGPEGPLTEGPAGQAEGPDPTHLLTSYLQATTGRPVREAPAETPRPDPLFGEYALPPTVEDSGPIPTVAPAPLVLPQQAPAVPLQHEQPEEPVGPPRLAPSVLDEPSVLQRAAARVSEEPDALVAVSAPVAPAEPQGNEAIVARALASIKEHANEPVVPLPSPDDSPVPSQRDRRAPKGGKRAKR